MKFDLLAVFLCMTIASTIGSDEHRPKLKIKDDARGKRNLEYQISHNYPIGANFRLERKISSGPPNFHLNSRFPTYFGPRPQIHRGRPHSIPPYAVQMEPLVQYSQRDPLYDTSKLPLTAEEHNDLSKPEDLLTDNNHLSENVYSQNIHGSPYGHHQNEPPVYYQKEPEPIIEIIIKESNVTLPPVPVPTLPPKKKEPVQVFYVKYKKNPNGYGKDSVIYDKPVPALTPHVHEEEHEEPQLDQPHQEYVTSPPPPSTTLRTIIRPDSETYIGTSGIHVTFGSEDKKHKSSPEGHEESAPQPAVAFPQAQAQQQLPHNNQNPHQIQHHQQQQHQQHHHHHHQQQHHHHQQPQPQFSQPIPERKPPTSAFPPNFNPPINFNQQTFGSRPVPNQPPQFTNTQYRPVHQQPARPFPAASQNQQQRPPIPPQRTFQQQQPFNHQRPVGPPQLPSLPSVQRPSFNQPPPQFPPSHFNQNHQTPPFTLNQFSLNNQFPPNNQFQFSQPNQPFPPSNQFPGFSQSHFSQQSQKQQFSQILNQRPQTHFPIVQQPQFNHKPQVTNEQFKHQQHSQQLRGNQQPPQQQQQQRQQQQQIKQQQQHQQQQQQQQQHQQQQHQQQQHQQQQNYQFHNQNVQPNRPSNQPTQHHHQQQQSQIQHHQQQHSHQSQQQNHQQTHQPNHQQNHQQSHQLNQQHQQHLQQIQQSTPHIIPPGGELLKSVPKYEQHISIPAEPAPQINNAQALPLQSQSSINQNVASPKQAHHQLNQQQSNHQNYQQLQIQLQQQINQQQQFNQQLQQQLQQDQLLQQQKTLSPLDFRQQIQEQFQFPLESFAQLNNIQHKVSPTTSTPKQQENIYLQSNSQRSQTSSPLPQNYFNIQQQQSSIFQHQNIGNIYQNSATSPNLPSSTATPKIIYQSTTTTTSTTTSKPIEKTEDKKSNKLPSNIQLPDEVPDDLREQLLSSGILSNADISVLDYDKIGDIPIDALPPDQLANFYGAGGAQQLAASERKETFLKPDGQPIDSKTSMVDMDEELSAEESEIDEVKTFEPSKQPEMKVVRYDSQSEQGQSVQNSYVRDDATHVDPVVLNDNKYNRYLPLKVSGAQFPIPDVPELKGRNITSVVVLAPVDYEFHQHNKNERSARDIEGDIKDVKLRSVDALKELLKDPTKENYKRWLEKENQTAADKQSVILLVTGSPDNNEKEIFMYDVASKTVSKLSGELSSAFVEAAESNASDEIPEASQVYESRIDVQKS